MGVSEQVTDPHDVKLRFSKRITHPTDVRLRISEPSLLLGTVFRRILPISEAQQAARQPANLTPRLAGSRRTPPHQTASVPRRGDVCRHPDREVDTLTRLSSRQFLAVLVHGDGVDRVAVEFESQRSNVGEARRFVRQRLVAWGLDEDDALIDRVVLVLSELVTNAVVHGRTRPSNESEAVGVALAFKPNFAFGLMVTDNSSSYPIPTIRPSAGAIRGRGLVLVNAHSDCWTSAPRKEGDCPGKAVWAFFHCAQPT
ncbi:ATP-binding protein [Streptomyces goshikiensis]|uniref:ATP-binding protein n=1 Tax=Streptomyces goshikiensis TaxID=1942 RepID=UPI0036888FCA